LDKKGVAKVSNELPKTKNALVSNGMKAFAGTFGSPAIMPIELLTRGFASLPFGSFALSVIKLLNNIIEHFEDEVNYYSDWIGLLVIFY